jgi:hypothetical protein
MTRIPEFDLRTAKMKRINRCTMTRNIKITWYGFVTYDYGFRYGGVRGDVVESHTDQEFFHRVILIQQVFHPLDGVERLD